METIHERIFLFTSTSVDSFYPTHGNPELETYQYAWLKKLHTSGLVHVARGFAARRLATEHNCD
jgi:hypothetical protein